MNANLSKRQEMSPYPSQLWLDAYANLIERHEISHRQ